MRFRGLLLLSLLSLCNTQTLRAQEKTEFFPLSEVHQGLKGVGRTVFEGDKIEDFQVEIVGVLKNVLAPKHDAILARLSGGPLANTGVIAGMSGSPVYVDGKLLGAVSLSFIFSKEPLAGITPIQDILGVVPQTGSPPPAQTAGIPSFRIVRASTDSPEMARLVPEDEDGAPSWTKLLGSPADESGFPLLRLPARFSGFSSDVIQTFAPFFRKLGLEPQAGGTLLGGVAGAVSAGGTPPPGPTDLAPGSMVSLMLVRGDLDLNIDCTVTYRDRDNLYACGHRILMTGPVQFPFAPSRVLTTASNLLSSFKLDAPGLPAGSIRQDRFGAIYGVVGEKAPLIPVHVQIDSTLNRKDDYSFEIVQQNLLSPLLLNLTLVSTLGSTERMLGPSTLELEGKIRLSTGDTADLEDIFSGDINTAAQASGAVASPLAYILSGGFPDLRVDGIDIKIISRNEKRLATLEQVWSTKSEVRPGDRLEVTAVLRTPSGEAVVQKIPVHIPESVSDKTLSLAVGGGSAMNALQNRFVLAATTPRDVRQLLRALNRLRRNNRLYALLLAPQRSFVIQGDEYPSPPPSLVQTFLADPAVASSVVFNGTSVVGDFETKTTPYAIQGQKTLFLKVVNTGD